jgi:hypothetical protein
MSDKPVQEPTSEPASESWFDALPDELKSNEALSAWKGKSPADLLKSHVELEGKLGTAIFAPGEKATPEEKAAFQATLRKLSGVPEKIEDYKIDLPPEVPKDDPVVKALTEAGHKSGVNSAQLQSIIAEGAKSIIEHREAQKILNKDAMQKHFGAEFDAKLASAVKGLEGAGKDAGLKPEELADFAKDIASFPALFRVFSEIGKFYKEDSAAGTMGPGSRSTLSPAEKLFPKGKMGKYGG